jgi:hypothetical protein
VFHEWLTKFTLNKRRLWPTLTNDGTTSLGAMPIKNDTRERGRGRRLKAKDDRKVIYPILLLIAIFLADFQTDRH